MRVNKIDCSRNSFKPMEIRISIDNENDLRILWHLFNITENYLRTTKNKKYPIDNEYPFENEVWKLVDCELERINRHGD